jgi:histidinol-phosphate phosphatase family protein
MEKRKVVFLDRDGVINEKAPEGDYVTNWEDFRFLPGVPEALATLKRLGYLLVVVTNQRCVGRGIVSEEALRKIHARMVRELSDRGADLDAVYYCPHEMEEECDCRKPKPGMILSAIRSFYESGMEVDLSRSFIIGDSETDILAGRAVGMRTGFIGRTHTTADLYGGSLAAVVRMIKGQGGSWNKNSGRISCDSARVGKKQNQVQKRKDT